MVVEQVADIHRKIQEIRLFEYYKRGRHLTNWFGFEDLLRENQRGKKSSLIEKLGWKPLIELEEGIASTYEWFLSNHSEALNR